MDPLFIIFIFPVIWVLVVFMSSRLSGWKRLEHKYYYPNTYTGPILNPFIASIGIVKYGGVLKIGYTEEGLYLTPSFFFKLFHKPLLIPWSEITLSKKSRALYKYVVLRFNIDPPLELLLTESFANKILRVS